MSPNVDQFIMFMEQTLERQPGSVIINPVPVQYEDIVILVFQSMLDRTNIMFHVVCKFRAT